MSALTDFEMAAEVRRATAEARSLQAQCYRAEARAYRLQGRISTALRYKDFDVDYDEIANQYTAMAESLESLESPPTRDMQAEYQGANDGR